MSETFDRAMDRIRDEMAQSRVPGVQGAGEMMTAMLRSNPEWAEKILNDKKTLADLYATMEQTARKKASGGMYYMPPTEAMKIAREYYGLDGDMPDVYSMPAAPDQPPRAPEQDAHAPAPVEPEEINELDALLAGL